MTDRPDQTGDPRIEQVLSFWFAERGVDGGPSPNPRWFVRDPDFDARIRGQFGACHAEGAAGGLTDWAEGPRGTLALVLVLDQFSRNLFRDDGRAYACDGRARGLVGHALAMRWDGGLHALERGFLYMPLMHSEDAADQARAVALYEALRGAAGMGDWDPLRYAREHKAVIDRFRRFPHRNAALGRVDTDAERAYLRDHPTGF